MFVSADRNSATGNAAPFATPRTAERCQEAESAAPPPSAARAAEEALRPPTASDDPLREPSVGETEPPFPPNPPIPIPIPIPMRREGPAGTRAILTGAVMPTEPKSTAVSWYSDAARARGATIESAVRATSATSSVFDASRIARTMRLLLPPAPVGLLAAAVFVCVVGATEAARFTDCGWPSDEVAPPKAPE